MKIKPEDLEEAARKLTEVAAVMELLDTDLMNAPRIYVPRLGDGLTSHVSEPGGNSVEVGAGAVYALVELRKGA